MYQCSKCGEMMSEPLDRCPKCGARLSGVKCVNCGYNGLKFEFVNNDHRCPKCNTSMAGRESKKNGFAIAAVIVGTINLGLWFFPFCGGPLGVIGIILGVFGLRSERKGIAIAGMALSGIGLIASIAVVVFGITLTGK